MPTSLICSLFLFLLQAFIQCRAFSVYTFPRLGYSTALPVSSSSSGGSDQIEDHNSTFYRRNKYWIVLVDDEESIRLAIGDFLYDAGYCVTACADGPALLELLEEQQQLHQQQIVDIGPSRDKDHNDFVLPHVIVTDIRMPGTEMNGLELLSILKDPPPSSDLIINKQRQEWKTIPTVILSAKSLTHDRVEGYRLGCDAYLSKPFDPEELLAILDNLIRRKVQQMQRSLSSSQMKTMNTRLRHHDSIDVSAYQRRMGKDSSYDIDDSIELSSSELDVLCLLSKGYTNGEIAKARGNASAASVNRILGKLYSKTFTKNRTELLSWAMRSGYVK